jgi:predicted nucleic acid-binding protein
VNALIDTSVWSLAFRRHPHDLSASERSIIAELAELIREGRARMIGLVRQELLSGIKTPAQYEKVRATLRAFPDEPIDTSDYETVAKHSNECRSKGVVVSLADILICSIALSRGWSVFTTDPDFDSYAAILRIKLHAPRQHY